MDIHITGLCQRFGEKTIFDAFDLELRQGGLYGLTAPSGRGKTTLLRILLGLQKPDAGEITQGVRYSAVFQTDRLLPGRTPVDQLLFVRGSRKNAEECKAFLLELLPADCLEQPVEELSGGMQRRIAIARALWADSDCVLMDEPFTGLDEDTLKQTASFILQNRRERTLLLSTHQKEMLSDFPFHWLTLPE